MKLTPAMRAAVVVVAVAIFLGLLWVRYDSFLSQGQRPPEAAQILNQIEKTGLPKFSIKGLDGAELSLEKFKGKVVILNFWASWCDPCIAEFPSLLTLIKKFKGDVVLLAISADYELRDIETFLSAFKLKDPHVYVAWDKDLEVAKKFGTYKLPESYIIGRRGDLVRKIAGVDDWSTPDAIEYFRALVQSHP